jgi:putative acetyltransferase
MTIQIARTPEDFAEGKKLFLEYAQSLDFSLCFQGFEQELADIHVQYAAPNGALLLVKNENEMLGCAGVRRWQGDTAELKRMYLRAAARGHGMGRHLLDAALECARTLGYRAIRLDTLPTMQTAIALYRAAGFQDIAAYRENPFEGVIYLEKNLQSP